MAARVVHALGSGVCEALPVQLVNDIFFLHERAYPGVASCDSSLTYLDRWKETQLLHCVSVLGRNRSLVCRIHAGGWILMEVRKR